MERVIGRGQREMCEVDPVNVRLKKTKSVREKILMKNQSAVSAIKIGRER